jgi:hypothetical protein
VYGIPLPSDCTPISGSVTGLCLTQIGTVSQLTAYYKTFMGQSGGWTFEPAYSVMDPDQGVTKSLGYTTTQFWCRSTSPITTVDILVGSGSSKDQGNHAEIGVLDDPGESSCP